MGGVKDVNSLNPQVSTALNPSPLYTWSFHIVMEHHHPLSQPSRPSRASWFWAGHKKVPSWDLSRDPALPPLREDATEPAFSFGSRPRTADGVSPVSAKLPRRHRRLSGSVSSLTHILSFPTRALTFPSPDMQQANQFLSSSNGSSAHLAVPSRSDLPSTARSTGSFGKMALNSMIGGLTSLSLSRNNDDKDKESRGRSSSRTKPRSSSFGFPRDKDRDRDSVSLASKDSARARSQSPFSLRRFRSRDQSPAPLPLEESDSESIICRRSPNVRPRNAFTDDGDSGEECTEETEDDEDDWSDDGGMLDFVTERNTEQNAQITMMSGIEADADGEAEGAMDPDPLGEGVNVVVPSEPYFPSTLNRSSLGSTRGKRGVKRRKSRHHELLPLTTSRPLFERDRCTITLTQGHPSAAQGRKKTYVVASDLSDESRYAVEWGIGTVLRDGDELLIVTVVENENKVDPITPNPTDRTTKLRSQQERQGMAYILLRQATSLLQRTRLHASVSCQAWHAKNARHMLLDIVDHNDPTMLIVGSRGTGQLKGILLGSTSHYLIQRCSVPVMVTRRRLKRPPKRSAHLAKHRAHVSLAEAGIDRVAAKVDHDVAVMRNEMQREDDRRGEANVRGAIAETAEGDADAEEGDAEGDVEGELGTAEGDGAEGEGFLGTKIRG